MVEKLANNFVFLMLINGIAQAIIHLSLRLFIYAITVQVYVTHLRFRCLSDLFTS